MDHGAEFGFDGEGDDQGEVEECWCVAGHYEHQDEVHKEDGQSDRHGEET